MVSFSLHFSSLLSATEPSGTDQRSTIGQIGNYMIELELKYGFLTNYDHTFFLKRETNYQGKESIYCSRPIRYDESLRNGNRISVRQALLFMTLSVQGSEEWYARKSSKTCIIKQEAGETVRQTIKRVEESIEEDDIEDPYYDDEDLAQEFKSKVTLQSARPRARFENNPVTEGKKSSSAGRNPRK